MASRTPLTHELAFGPAAVVEAEVELLDEVRGLLDDDAVDDDEEEAEEDADGLVDDAGVEVEVVDPPPVSEPHPTRARTARPAAARGRWRGRVGMCAGYRGTGRHRGSRPISHTSHKDPINHFCHFCATLE
ncbi:hypothetical protein ASG73_07690 [Janibacter sp. Soil728]|nr:hypothetical protein ASG73_07690 [Janibacter sp. Soil728]